MPSVPDASMMTRYRRVAATITADPEKKSRTFVSPIKDIGAETKVAEVTRNTSFSVLQPAQWKSPQFNGRIFLK